VLLSVAAALVVLIGFVGFWNRQAGLAQLAGSAQLAQPSSAPFTRASPRRTPQLRIAKPVARLTGPATAGCDLTVSVFGRDNASGRGSRPFRTIQRLLPALRPGMTGCLLGGTFRENVVFNGSGRLNRRITLRSAPGLRTRILGYVWVRSGASWVTLSHVNVDAKDAQKPFAVLVQGDHVVLSNLDVTNDKHNGVQVDGICVTAGYGFEHDRSNSALALTIARSRIHDCGDDPHEQGLYLESTRGAEIRDNYLYRNPGYGISMYPDAQGSTIEHNVLDSNSLAGRANITFSGEAAGGEYSKPHGSDGNVVRFNIISNPAQRYNVDSYYPGGSVLPTNNRVVDNCVWNGPYGNFGGTDRYSRAGNREVDPLYTNAPAFDYRLRTDSPCLGWGPRIGAVTPAGRSARGG
jgi:hypothetical protein